MSAVSNGCPTPENWLTWAENTGKCSLTGLTQFQAMNAYLAAEIKTAKCLCPTVFDNEASAFGCTFNNEGSVVTFDQILARIECGNNLLSEQEVWNALAKLAFARITCCEQSPIYA